MTQAFSASSERFSQSALAISAGEGTRNGSSPSSVGERAVAGGDLPGADQRRQQQRRVEPARAASRPLTACPVQRPQRRLAGGDEVGRGDGRVALGGTRARRRQLGDDPARPGREHQDPVGEVERLLDVVADQDHGARVLAQRRRQPLLHLGPGDRVERREGLVEGQHRLAGDQRAQEGDPLAHPARELGRGAGLEALEPEALEQRRRPAPRLGPAEAAVAQRQRRVVERRVPGQQGSCWGM